MGPIRYAIMLRAKTDYDLPWIMYCSELMTVKEAQIKINCLKKDSLKKEYKIVEIVDIVLNKG